MAALLIFATGLFFVLRHQFRVYRSHQRVAAEARQRQRLFDALRPVVLSNCRLERFGEPHDGGYLMCANLLESVQAGYSYGINGFDQWGCDVSTKRGVPLHQYDCFDTRTTSCPTGKVVFHPECISDAPRTQDGLIFDTFANQLAKNGDRGKRVVLKIDVEGAEWDSFLHASDEVLGRIDQLVVEFHGVREIKHLIVVERLKRLFHVAHLHFNNYSCDPSLAPFPAWAYEVLFVNKRIGVVDPSRRAGGLHQLDAPNAPDGQDCQAGHGE
jgi:hypothetical protein